VSHAPSGKICLFYGLLGYEGGSEITIPQNVEVVKTYDGRFQLEGTDFSISSVYHLMDAKVCQSLGFGTKYFLNKTNTNQT